jgi:CheY-like chemotaxis protein
MVASVLLVDSHEKLRKALRQSFGRSGYTVFEAENSEDGLRAARYRQPDAVVLDLNGEVESEEFCRRFRSADSTLHIPILVLSTSGNLAVAERIFSAGADAYLAKPFRVEMLLSKIANLVNRESSESGDNLGGVPEELKEAYSEIREKGGKLGDMAEIFSGVSVRGSHYRRAASPGLEWLATLHGENVQAFRVTESQQYLFFDKRGMFRVPSLEEYDQPEKVVLHRTAPPIIAAVDTTRSPISSDLYSIIPARGLQCGYLACLLNSRLMDFYFNRIRPITSAAAGAYLRRVDLEAVPVILPSKSLQDRLSAAARELGRLGANPASPIARGQRNRLLQDVNLEIFEAYGFSPAAINRLGELHF